MSQSEYSFERYLNVRSAYGASFSADGTYLSFLTDITGVAEVWRVAVDIHAQQPTWPEQLTFRGERVSGAKFSPVDDTLLVVGDTGGSELAQLYTLSSDGAHFTALTDEPDVIHDAAARSPDGRYIAYRCNRRDQRYFDIYERNLESGEERCLLQDDSTNSVMRYSPDGEAVLVSRTESNVRNELFLVKRSTGEIRNLTPQLPQGPAEHFNAFWSADRRGLYLVTNAGREFCSLAWLDLATTQMTILQEGSWDIEALSVSKDGQHMALVTNEDGYSRLQLFDVSAGWEGRKSLPEPGKALPAGVIQELSWSKDGMQLAFTLYRPDAASDVWVWHVDEAVLWQATRSATGGIPQSSFVAPELVHYPTFDEREIPAFLYWPANGDRRDLPVVVYVHGGPESQSRPSFNSVIQYLAACGYAILVPNVRGSTGYGYTYQSLDDVRKRMDSVRDLQYAVLWLREQGIADPQRIAVMGGSYGGFMVLSAITTYPDLWAAAVDIVGIANFVTFLENTGPWRRKLREAEYGSLEHDREFLEQISPIHSVDKITAPLFVIHGANDPRVPVGEAEQIVSALRARHVPVEYMRFEDEGHGLIKRANRLIAYPAVARFLDHYLYGKK